MEEENFVTNLDTESYGLGELSGRYTPLSICQYAATGPFISEVLL
jgi:hypothetical protein